MYRWIFILILVGIAFPTGIYAQTGIPAFPGAEGFGSKTVGGRGGQIIKVTNLNASGTGSLKAAMEATGPRIVVFEVSGIIDMGCNAITVSGETKSFLTVAGQTAPGDGILLKGKILIRDTHDVVIRYLRIRPDDPGQPGSESCDGINIWSDSSAYNIVLDHNSVSWATDENLNISTLDPEGLGKNIRNVTLSWNIIAEGDADSTHSESDPVTMEHSMGGLIDRGFPPDIVEDVSIHHNLYIHNNKRNPLSSSGAGSTTPNTAGVVRFINNVVYNWGHAATTLGALANQVNRFDIIGNYYRSGPSTRSSSNVPIWCYGSGTEDAGVCRLYISGNTHQIGIDGTPTTADVTLRNGSGSTLTVERPAQPQREDGVQIDTSATALTRITSGSGATYPRRDSVDNRLITELTSGTGRVGIDNDHIRRYPTLNSTTPPADSDNDGMPNSWETARGLNPNLNDSAQDSNGDGYTNIEEYINSLVQPVNPTLTPTLTISPSPTPTSNPATHTIEMETCNLNNVSGIVTPFVSESVSGRTSIYQETNNFNVATSGLASCPVVFAERGIYRARGVVDAFNGNFNSLLLNLDYDPVSPDMIWNISTFTVGFEERDVSWQLTGSLPHDFPISPGSHSLIIRGREANTKLDKIYIYLQQLLNIADINFSGVVDGLDIRLLVSGYQSGVEDIYEDSRVNAMDIGLGIFNIGQTN
jgi:pectate lyase